MRANEETTMHGATHSPMSGPIDAWRELQMRARQAWNELAPRWRSEAVRVAAGLLVALVLLVAFHQIVAAGVERAAARDAALRGQQSVAALCSVERDAGQRALCLLTRPAGRGAVQVATLAR
jgi:hypothetical protein